MKRWQEYIWLRLIGDAQSDRVVPRAGYSAWLVVFTAGAMAFLAVFALALSLAAGRLADRWGAELARTSTVRISAPDAQVAAQTSAALNVLKTTPGVARARALTTEEQAALLQPWLGADLPIDSLPIPQLIEVVETSEGYDAEGLRLRLSAEAPGAVLDDHTRWRRPLITAANRLRSLGIVSMLLIGLATAAMVMLAANAALAANAQIIRVMRLVGARDIYIARAFVRRFTIRTFGGAFAGTLAAMLAVALLPQATDDVGFLTGLGFVGFHWLLPLLVPMFAAIAAFWATRTAALRTLGRLT